MTKKTVEVYVVLLEEGTDTIRGTQAIDLGDGLYQLLPTPWYDPEDEVWEFSPGSVVKAVDSFDDQGKRFLLAVEKVK